MTKTQAATAFVHKEVLRGLPVYLFEVADFFPGPRSFNSARRLVAKLIAAGEIVRDTCDETIQDRYEAAPGFKLFRDIRKDLIGR